ncbi:MAG: GAF domain-containing protein [Nitrospirota bacterium]|nr:GAF domain-containing protein [Nitrospirota bacterium]
MQDKFVLNDDVALHGLEGKAFFNNISRSVKVSHFVASIIPLSLLVYFSLRYVYPYVTHGDITSVPVDIMILLVLAVTVSVLGLVLTTKATNSSIKSAQDLNIKLNSLFEITKQFRETLYLDVLLEKIIRSAMDLTAAESGSILFYNNDGKLQYKINAGANSEKMNSRTIETGEGVANWVAESGKPAIINSPSKLKLSPDYDSNTGFKTISVLCVPLIHSEEIIGVIELRNKKNGMFNAKDEALLYSLADQASISIAQSRANEKQQSDFIHITEMLVNAQDIIQNKKGHARRVTNYANHIGRHLELSDPELKRLYYACLLHDIGMMKIDPEEHGKTDKILQHPKLGYDLVKSISLWSESANIILCHHERYDGTGYPLGIEKERIPLGSRILFVADTFDVLTSKYSYRTQLDYKAAITELEANAGTQFDPAVVEALKASIVESGILNE